MVPSEYPLSRAEQILASLGLPGRNLVFCDDTEISGRPVEWLAPDLRILCGLTIRSERYAAVANEMTECLRGLGQTEFHATEIVNPRRGSSWKDVSIDRRLVAMRLLARLVETSSTTLYRAHVSRRQYAELREQAEKRKPVGVAFKAGLKRVFLRSLCERLVVFGGETVVVLDQDKPLAGPALEPLPEGGFLVGGGPIAADSKSVLGLQLADMAAFSISRYLLKRDAIAKGKVGPFDQIVLELMAGIGARCKHLLDAGTVEKN